MAQGQDRGEAHCTPDEQWNAGEWKNIHRALRKIDKESGLEMQLFMGRVTAHATDESRKQIKDRIVARSSFGRSPSKCTPTGTRARLRQRELKTQFSKYILDGCYWKKRRTCVKQESASDAVESGVTWKTVSGAKAPKMLGSVKNCRKVGNDVLKGFQTHYSSTRSNFFTLATFAQAFYPVVLRKMT